MNEGKVSGENISRMGMLHFKMISFLTRKPFSGFMTVILTSPLFGILAIARLNAVSFRNMCSMLTIQIAKIYL